MINQPQTEPPSANPENQHRISFFLKNLYTFITLSLRAFFKDECIEKAALLTFYFLVAIVPFLALTLAIAKGFGFETFLQNEILKTFKEQKDVLNLAIEFSYSLIKEIQGGIIAGLGILFLFVSIFGLLQTIEHALNDIWKVKKRRSFSKKAVDYLAILIVCPIIFTISSSLTIFINTQLTTTFQQYSFLREISDYLALLLQIAPFFLSWMLFSIVYLFFPNTQMNVKPRLFAGFLAGTLFQLWQIAYIQFQFALSSYNVVYGSFAALPLFLIWTQVNFMIFLFGAEISAQIENKTFHQIKWKGRIRYEETSYNTLAVLILYHLVNSFLKGNPALSVFVLSDTLGIQLSKIRTIISILEKEKIVAELKSDKKGEEKYQLMLNPQLITLKKIFDLIDKNMNEKVVVKSSKELSSISTIMSKLDQEESSSKENLNLKDAVDAVEKESH